MTRTRRRRLALRWATWATVGLLGLAAIGFPPAFQLSRGAGAVLGLLLAVVLMGTEVKAYQPRRTSDEQSPCDGGLPLRGCLGEDRAHMGLLIGCFCIGVGLATGPPILGGELPNGEYARMPYAQVIRFWTLLDVGALALYAKSMRLLERHWADQAAAESADRVATYLAQHPERSEG